MKYFLYIIAFLPLLVLAQDQEKIDSLKNVIEKANHDTTVVDALLDWSTLVAGPDPAMDHDINMQIDSICKANLQNELSTSEEKKFLEIQALATNNLGFIYSDLGDFEIALHYHTLSMKIHEKLGDKVGVAGGYNNIGNLFKYQGDYRKAIEYLTKSLSIKEELGDKKGIANSLNNIGTIYRIQMEFDIAMDYYQRSLKLKEKLGYKKGIASSLNNIGIIYVDKGQNEKAIEYFKKSLKIKEELGNKKAISSGLNNIADTYNVMGRHEEALEYCLKGLKLREEIKYKKGIASSLANLAMIYTNMKSYDKAIIAGKRSLEISEEIGAKPQIRDVSESMWLAYKAKGNFKEALKMYELYRQTRDTLESEENKREVFKQEYKYQYEKQAAADSIKNAEAQKVKDAELALEKAENDKQKQRSYFLYGVIVLAIIFGVFIFNRFRVTKNQKIIIEAQKSKVDEAFDELEEKNNEIMDSIVYAKRIQSAILPSDQSIKEYLPNSFVLYKPKDIVAGDFYWMEVVSTNDCSPPSQGGVREAGGGFVSGKPKMNSEHLSEKRKNLRSNMTQAEAFLWDKLRNSQFEGRKFRRQHSIDNYIVDFYCASEKLVIELDGEVHNIEEQAKADQERDQRLKQYGITVLRFENHLVFDNYELVADRIREHFRNSTIDRHSNHPDLVSSATPPFKGGEQSMVLLAAADCTGHGVPGAMVSVVCNNGLNRSVREHGLTEPGKILDKTREIVLEEFAKSDEDVSDGMDVALVALVQSELESVPIAIGSEGLRTHTSHSLSFSGAHNPLWVIKKDSSEVHEIKGNKQPIGKFDNQVPFETHQMELSEGDTFYIFTDGFSDQFGGDKSKKLKTTNFKKLLVSIQGLSMKEQKERLHAFFEKWRGENEQIDDVCVIGVRL